MFTVNLELNVPSLLEAYAEINGLRVEVQENSTQVVVRNVDAADMDEAFNKARSAANHFLNTLSWKLNTDLKIETEASSVTLMESSGKKHVSIRPRTAKVGLKAKLVAVHKDASGNIISVSDSQKPGRINVKPSDAAAYYRRAHLTDDPFDRFRNLYFAVENVSDRIRMKRGLNKQGLSELRLLRLGLDECFANNLHPLIEATKGIYTFDNNQSLVPQVAEMLYKRLRCALNHAKDSEDKKIPFNLQDEEEVKTALPLMNSIAISFLKYEETSL